jgi:hypothetical protein
MFDIILALFYSHLERSFDMSIWLWVFVISNIVYWSIFIYLLTRRRWDAPALTVGVLHMLFASLIVAAPIRSFFDPDYIGYQLGIVRFEGRWAVLPATLFLVWALSSAWIAIDCGRGRWMKLLAVGDILFALNLGGGFLLDLVRGDLAESRIQGGEFFTLSGIVAALIPLLLFALPFAASAVWAARRAHSGGTTPPLAQGSEEVEAKSERDSKDINGFRYSASSI